MSDPQPPNKLPPNPEPPKKRPSDAAIGGRVATVVLLGLALFVTLIVVFAG